MVQAPPSILTEPMVANAPIRLRLGVFVVACGQSWIPAVPPVALTCSQYVVLGCSATSSGVVNVISWEVAVSAVEVVKVDKHGLAGKAFVVCSYGDLWGESAGSQKFAQV